MVFADLDRSRPEIVARAVEAWRAVADLSAGAPVPVSDAGVLAFLDGSQPCPFGIGPWLELNEDGSLEP